MPLLSPSVRRPGRFEAGGPIGRAPEVPETPTAGSGDLPGAPEWVLIGFNWVLIGFEQGFNRF